MSEPLLFLDIDGVLNRHKQHPRTRFCRTDEDLVLRLDEILVATDCRIVLTSAWRYLVHGGSMGLEGLRHVLDSHWIDGSRLLGITRRDITDGTQLEKANPRSDRGFQITEWMDDNEIARDWSHYSYCVIDDMDLDITAAGHGRHFVETNGDHGLSATNVAQAIAILKGQNVFGDHAP